MKTNNIINLLKLKLDIPNSIEKGIINLFGVEFIKDINEKIRNQIYNKHETFFDNNCISYNGLHKEYTIYYLPANFYKVWRPLTDLLEKSQIKQVSSILELGSGPGSTTFGLLEFYRYLAIENFDLIFEVQIDLVEKEKGFIEIFDFLFNHYKKDIPSNLIIKINKYNMNMLEFFKQMVNQKYDYVIESNMLNPNEEVDMDEYNLFANDIKKYLNPNASIILIEPAKKELSEKLRSLKSLLENNGLSTFSPCSCAVALCKQFPIAIVDLRGVSLLNDLGKYNIISKNKISTKHNFEYFILRNDNLKKYKQISNKIALGDLQHHIDENINFKAYILYFRKFDNEYRIKVCDGTLCDGSEVWIRIPEMVFNDLKLDFSSVGRGGIINVKRAKVENKRNIVCLLSTAIELER